jgi:hypothetical protein
MHGVQEARSEQLMDRGRTYRRFHPFIVDGRKRLAGARTQNLV